VISGVARVPSGGKKIFAPPPTKAAEFKVKKGAKARQKQKRNICCLLLLFIT